MKKQIRLAVSNDKINNIWVGSDSNGDAIRESVSPDFYECNGTPVDDQGDDMSYSHTEVDMPQEIVDICELVRMLASKNYTIGKELIEEVSRMLIESLDKKMIKP
jgi:hypothetical protein